MPRLRNSALVVATFAIAARVYAEPEPCTQAAIEARIVVAKLPADEPSLRAFVRDRLDHCDAAAWSEEFRTRLQAIDAQLAMRRCEKLLGEQSTEASACYRGWVNAHPTDRDVDLARFNGAFAFLRQKRGDDAVALLSALVAHAKEGPLVARALWTLAQVETDRGHLAVAAGFDERLAREFPKDEHGLDALHNAALLRMQLGDCKAATDHARTLARRCPADHEEARFAAEILHHCGAK